MEISQIKINRETFLTALRSGEYEKGPIEDDGYGKPPDGATGYCAVGLAYVLFHDEARPGALSYTRTALGFTRKDFTKIQKEWNDSVLTFVEIADLIQAEIIG